VKNWERRRGEATDFFFAIRLGSKQFAGDCVMIFELTYPARLIDPDPAVTRIGARRRTNRNYYKRENTGG
jgi:hypothetical protein